jgi:hypothetical protein
MHRLWFAFVLFPFALISGCSGNGPEIAPAGGRITYQGKPLVKAHVFFAPVSGERMATGYTDENGRFRLGTLDIADGAIVGKHRVSVQAHGPPKPLPPGQGSGLPGDMLPGDPIIPLKYFQHETSGLEREVQPGNNEFEIDLTD